MLPGIISTLREGCSPTQIKQQPLLCNFILSPAFFVSSLQLSLGSHFVISRIAGNKSKANYSLLASGLLDPRMGRLQDTQKSRKLGRDRKNSIPQGRTVEF